MKESDTTEHCFSLNEVGTCESCWPNYYMGANRACTSVGDLYDYSFSGVKIMGVL